tara:strand:- start:6654 stop:6896 length:243 start_codon:yes stop_codon:yes gene_type:complete
MSENKKLHCLTSSNCYAIIALCIALFTLGLLVGSWVGNCQKATKCNKTKKYQYYSVDGKAGSTCNWSKKEKECRKDSLIK